MGDIAGAALLTLTAIARSGARGRWCPSPRSVVTIYAAMNSSSTNLDSPVADATLELKSTARLNDMCGFVRLCEQIGAPAPTSM